MKWLQLMLAAMLANGLALIGAKVLTETGLSEKYKYQYFFGWYAAGTVAALLYSVRSLSLPWRKELSIGAAMAAMSFVGQWFLVAALNGGAPAYLVYPIAGSANVLLVAILGVLLFREKIGKFGITGIICGLISVTLLSLP